MDNTAVLKRNYENESAKDLVYLFLRFSLVSLTEAGTNDSFKWFDLHFDTQGLLPGDGHLY